MTVSSLQRTSARRDHGYRRDVLWIAALIHRLSGLLLAAFLPAHFLVLALAISGADSGQARLDGFLDWTRQPLVKLAESGLIALLVVHLAGGLRLLVIELWAWHGAQKAAAIGSIAVAIATGAAFLIHNL